MKSDINVMTKSQLIKHAIKQSKEIAIYKLWLGGYKLEIKRINSELKKLKHERL